MRVLCPRFPSSLAACGAAVLACSVFTSHAVAGPLTGSRFTNSSDGWTVVDLNYTDISTAGSVPTARATYTPTYNALGGYLSMDDPSTDTWYWSAPTKFLGDQSAAYGGTLHFELSQNPADSQVDLEDVILIGGGSFLSFNTTGNPGTGFTAYDVSLAAGGWHLGGLGGALATQADILNVLGSLEALYIRGEYRSGSDMGALDNVSLNAVPEPGTAALLAAALLPLALGKARRRRNA